MRIAEESFAAYCENLLQGRRDECASLVMELVEGGIALQPLYRNLFERSLYAVGTLWERNRISVAAEHRATAITEWLLAIVGPRVFHQPPPQGRAVVCCAPNEYHQVGAHMVADILTIRGWDTDFLGANTPTQDLLALLNERQPDLLALSVSIHWHIPKLLSLLADIEGTVPNLQVVVGGQAFRAMNEDMLAPYPNARRLTDLDDLAQVTPRDALEFPPS